MEIQVVGFLTAKVVIENGEGIAQKISRACLLAETLRTKPGQTGHTHRSMRRVDGRFSNGFVHYKGKHSTALVRQGLRLIVGGLGHIFRGKRE